MIPYKVINRMFTTIYGIITGSLSAYYLCAKYIVNVIRTVLTKSYNTHSAKLFKKCCFMFL